MCVLTGPCEGLIDGADVDPRGGGFAVGFGDQPDQNHLCVELLGPAFSDLTRFTIPTSALHEETVDVAACVWLLCYL